jgi:hypothetical protein
MAAAAGAPPPPPNPFMPFGSSFIDESALQLAIWERRKVKDILTRALRLFRMRRATSMFGVTRRWIRDACIEIRRVEDEFDEAFHDAEIEEYHPDFGINAPTPAYENLGLEWAHDPDGTPNWQVWSLRKTRKSTLQRKLKWTREMKDILTQWLDRCEHYANEMDDPN